ncbi:hypothetical protein GBAR_LOCUS3229 [Geodia barretti]|nr:hypothetical protein GBAR_LOCUS3229 [Geodia barretti]
MASMSAEQESVEVAQKAKKSAGVSTAQYKAVNENRVKLTRNIKATTDAEETLNDEFRRANWQDANSISNTRDMITKALNKIENDANQYVVFYGMLKDITGLDIPLPSLSVISEESDPRDSQDLVTSYTKKKLVEHEQSGQNPEPDSGYLGFSGKGLADHDGDIIDGDRSTNPDVPVPTSTDDSNTSYSQEEVHPKFTIEETGTETLPKQASVFIPSFKEEAAMMNKRLLELHDRAQGKLHKRIKELEKLLQEEGDAKEALQREIDEKSHQFSQYKSNAERTIEESENELQQLKAKLSATEKEKKDNESKYNEEVKQLKKEVEDLKERKEKEKQAAELQLMRLERDLCIAEKELAEKKIVILNQQCEKAELEKKIVICSKDDEIRKLKVEKKRLMRGQSLHRSLSSLDINDR